MTRGLAVLLLFVAIVAGCTKISSPPGAMDVTKQETPQQEFYDATITFYQGDKLNGVLKAGRIRKFEKSATILLDSNVVMDFYNEQGQHTSTLWADSARTDDNRKDMVAMGNVIAKSDSGDRLETTELRWDNRTRQVRSDTRVKLMTPTDTINGVGFVSDEHLKNWHVGQPFGRTFRDLERRTTTTRDTVLTGVTPNAPIRLDTLKLEDSIR